MILYRQQEMRKCPRHTQPVEQEIYLHFNRSFGLPTFVLTSEGLVVSVVEPSLGNPLTVVIDPDTLAIRKGDQETGGHIMYVTYPHGPSARHPIEFNAKNGTIRPLTRQTLVRWRKTGPSRPDRPAPRVLGTPGRSRKRCVKTSPASGI